MIRSISCNIIESVQEIDVIFIETVASLIFIDQAKKMIDSRCSSTDLRAHTVLFPHKIYTADQTNVNSTPAEFVVRLV
jgi:hypothetical protein